MQYKDFCAYLQRSLPGQFPEATYFNFRRMKAPDGRVSEALTIEAPGDRILPVFWLKDYYRFYLNGVSLTEIGKQISDIYLRETASPWPELRGIGSFEEQRSRLRLRLMNGEMLQPAEPALIGRKFLDLSVLYELLLDPGEGFLTGCLVNAELLELWKVTEPEVFEAAMENTRRNTPPRFRPLSAVLEELMGTVVPCTAEEGTGSSAASQLYILSNDKARFGAAVILLPNCLSSVYSVIGPFYLLPSSVHEWLILPHSPLISPEKLRDTVREINSSVVDPQDLLSNNIYRYCPEAGLQLV